MKEKFLGWVVLAVVLSFFATSCSNDDDEGSGKETPAVVNPGTPQRTYSLNWKITNDNRPQTSLKDQFGGILACEFNQIIFEYNSVGPDMKTPVRMTGTINIPRKIFNKENDARHLLLYNQFTHAQNGEKMSEDSGNELGLFMTESLDCIAISTDSYGWTLTKDKPQAYCCPEIYAVEQLDCYDAAMEILKSKGYKVDKLPISNCGYSSGGMLSIGVQKFVDEKRPDLSIAFTGVGSSPYDINAVWQNYVETNFTGYMCSMPLIMVAYNETYNMGFKYDQIFKQPLCDHIQDWILSKKYCTGDINDRIGRDKPVDQVLTDAARDWTKGLGKVMHDKFDENSLCGPNANWQPDTKTHYYVMHSAGDKYMDKSVSEMMANYLKKKGCTNVVTDFADYGNHCEAAILVFCYNTFYLMEYSDGVMDQDAAELNGQLIKLLVDVQTHPEKYKELFDSIKSLFDGQ